MRKIFLLAELMVFLQFALCFSVRAQSDCPECTISLPVELPEDTIFLSDAPTGRVNDRYEGTISFRLPKSTTPVAEVDTGTAPGINLDRITIKSISNLPPGLSWEANQLEFNVREETDGCMQICGRPLQPGIYQVEVVVEARVLVINQTTFFTFPIEILPAERITDGFTITNSSGCGQVEAGFVNNIPSEGRSGYTYLWDFGDGDTSLEEAPGARVYEQPGDYEVNYRAIVDTVGFILTNVVLQEVDCSDALGGRPDLYFKVFNGAGEEVLSTPTVNNADLPLAFSLNLPIDTGTYTLQVFDNDTGLGGGDDLCGEAGFNRFAEGSLTAENFAATLTLIHPVDTITAKDTVRVFSVPDVPGLVLDSGPGPFCEADTAIVSSNVIGQWYRNDVPFAAGVDSIRIFAEGAYHQVFTDAFGCQATSDSVLLNFNEIPPAPVFTVEDNLLSVFEESELPAEPRFDWFLDDELLPGAEETHYCAEVSGRYQLVVTDLGTGCTNSYSRQVTVDPAVVNCNITSLLNEETGIATVRLFPNPAGDWVDLQFDFSLPQKVEWRLMDARGAFLQRDEMAGQGVGFTHRIDLSDYPAGVYLLQLRTGKYNEIRKLIKR